MTTPAFVTETDEPAPWLDCTWAAALMLANKGSGNAYPATRAEREALRVASGDQSPSNSGDAVRGLSRRYGHSPERPPDPQPRPGADRGWVLARLEHGYGASMGLHFPDLSPHLRRWDSDYLGNHRVYIERYDPLTKRVWWMDPLGRGAYKGEWAYLAQFDAAMWWGDSLVVKEDTWEAALADVKVTNSDDVMLDLPAGAKILNPNGTLRTTLGEARTFRSPCGGVTDGGTATRLIVYTRGTAGDDLLLACYASAAQNVRQEAEAKNCTAEVAAAIAADRKKAHIVYS